MAMYDSADLDSVTVDCHNIIATGLPVFHNFLHTVRQQEQIHRKQDINYCINLCIIT